MASAASETFTFTNAPIQYAAIKAFRGGIEIVRYLWNSQKILKALATEVLNMLINGGIKTSEPEGAFYLFLNFSNDADRLNAKNIFTSLELTSVFWKILGLPFCLEVFLADLKKSTPPDFPMSTLMVQEL
jgi:aspartate/methionine/tyrosine aminotransferase